MTVRIAVLDYEAGNVRSAQRGLERAGAEAFVTDDAERAATADALLVPGVGHFATCLARLRSSGLESLVRGWIADDRHVFGVCVGLQLLYERSGEGGGTDGLGLLPGEVVRFREGITVPHMGWDVVEPAEGHERDPLLEHVAGERCYFVHSYYAVPADDAHVVATTDYGGAAFPSIVRVGNVVGTQFHPEKSADVGAALLTNWVRAVETGDQT